MCPFSAVLLPGVYPSGTQRGTPMQAIAISPPLANPRKEQVMSSLQLSHGSRERRNWNIPNNNQVG